MRLADLILSHGVRMPPSSQLDQTDLPELEAGLSASARDHLLRSPVIVATNVYEYVRNRANELDIYALPCAAPPFPDLWLEYEQRNGKQVGLAAIVDTGPFALGEPQGPRGENGFVRLSPTPGEGDRGMWLSDNLPDRAAWEKVRWLWTMQLYQSDGRLQPYGPITMQMVALDEWGGLLDLTYHFRVPIPDGEEPPHSMTLNPLEIFITTINLMQCANIRTVYVDPPAALSRKHRRKGHLNRDMVRYGVLQIGWEGPEQRVRSPARGSQNLLDLHLVKGSIHHYGNCCPGRHPPKGLYFGKREGRIWVPSHVRGDPDRGVIVNDFEVAEPPALPAPVAQWDRAPDL